MLNVKKNKSILLTACIFITLQLSYSIAKLNSANNAEVEITNQIEARIAKDLARLPLPNPIDSSEGNNFVVESYIERLNKEIRNNSLSPKLLAIQSDSYELQASRKLINRRFDTPNLSVTFVMSVKTHTFWDLFSLLALIVSVGFYFMLNYRVYVKNENLSVPNDLTDDEPTRLVIDLEQKLLINSKTHEQAPLANKPLCFYTALIEYCAANPDVLLNQNKEVPQELIDIANKYFYRLTELGHTIRKRPNFSNSLEKTLSEIRAAIDDVLQDEATLKECVFPPKAHGEGSRSKLHNYGLKISSLEVIEIIGK